jgi:membrane-associated protease RseP (regulator of RpoE activity)
LNVYAIALVAILTYLAVLIVGRQLKLWKRLGISLYGPVMMIRTGRGRRIFDRLAVFRRFWAAYGWISVAVTMASLVVVMAFLVWQAFLASEGVAANAAQDELRLGLPGVSPVLTIIYVVVGLTVAVIVHEYAHGILARVARLKVASLGVLILVIPIGAFIEPDDKDLKNAPKGPRMRLFAAGPATNMFVAAICLTLLLGVLGPSVKPVEDGAIVTDIAPESPAKAFGIPVWSEIVAANGFPVSNGFDLESTSFGAPGEAVEVRFVYKSVYATVDIPGGVVVTSVSEGPAFDAGIRKGMIVKSLNGTLIPSVREFRSITENATHSAPVSITALGLEQGPAGSPGRFVEDPGIRSINLISKWLFYYTHFPSENREDFKNVSYMGVSVSPFGVTVKDSDYLIRHVAHPFKGAEGFSGWSDATLKLLSLPFLGISPVVSPAADLYEPTGALGFVPHQVYWIMVNLSYWLFWANLMVGLANALPALPMDGGYVLGDMFKRIAQWRGDRLTGFDRAIGRRPVSDAKVDMLMIAITLLVSGLILYLMARQAFGPF